MLYHYTILVKLQQILEDGKLKAGANAKKYGGKDLTSLWFSTDPRWETTASKQAIINGTLKELSMEELHQLMGLARIGAEKTDNFISWAKYCHLSGLPDLLLRRMETRGDCRQWFCLLNDLPADKWKTIELWDGYNWTPYNEENMKEMLIRYQPAVFITQDKLQR
jgi:hypothetical protein